MVGKFRKEYNYDYPYDLYYSDDYLDGDVVDVEFISEETYQRSKTLWDSGMEFFRVLEIHIPVEFLTILRYLERRLHTEFAFLLKIEENLPVIKVVDWFFPRQRVSAGDVEILERKEGYEGVLHKHPENIRAFSEVDWDYLNRNYKLSLLYCSGDIVDCAYRISVNGKYTWLTEFKVVYTHNINIDDLLDKIEDYRVREKEEDDI